MIPGIVIALGFGLTIIGGSGLMDSSTELYPDKGTVTLFSIIFLIGMAMLGGGLGSIA